MRYCAACGEPIPAHRKRVVPPAVRLAITNSARTALEAARLIRGAGRVCPVTPDPITGNLVLERNAS